MITAKDYLDTKTIHVDKSSVLSLNFDDYVEAHEAYKAVDMAKNEFAESIIRMINNYQEQKVKGNIADFVKSYCEGYCEGIINFIQ